MTEEYSIGELMMFGAVLLVFVEFAWHHRHGWTEKDSHNKPTDSGS